MPTLNITNNGLTQSGLSDPATLFFEQVAPGANAFSITSETLDNLQEQLEQLAARRDSNGDPVFDIDVASDGVPNFGGSESLAHYLANKVNVDTVVSTATAGASIVSVRRVDVAAGEAMVDGALFIYAASVNEVGDNEIDKDGADVSAVVLSANKDSYTHFVLVNDSGALKTVLVRGDEFDTGLAEPLTDAQIASALGVVFNAGVDLHSYVRIADVLYEESGGLSETITSLRPAPPEYG